MNQLLTFMLERFPEVMQRAAKRANLKADCKELVELFVNRSNDEEIEALFYVVVEMTKKRIAREERERSQ